MSDDMSRRTSALIMRVVGQLRKSMGMAGRQRVLERFTWDRVSENILDKYKNIYEIMNKL